MTCTVLSPNSKTNKSSPPYRWSQKCQLTFFLPGFCLFSFPVVSTLFLCGFVLWSGSGASEGAGPAWQRWKQHWHSWKWQVWQAKLCTNWLLCLSLLLSSGILSDAKGVMASCGRPHITSWPPIIICLQKLYEARTSGNFKIRLHLHVRGLLEDTRVCWG